jgi:hypothetical protein
MVNTTIRNTQAGRHLLTHDKTSNTPRKITMNNNLANVTRTLRQLMQALPAMQQHSSTDVLQRHLELIAHFQRRYDHLISLGRPNS